MPGLLVLKSRKSIIIRLEALSKPQADTDHETPEGNLSTEIGDHLETVFGKRLSTVIGTTGAILALLGLSNVVNDIWDGAIVWYGFLSNLHNIYNHIREFLILVLFSWWIPDIPRYIVDFIVIYLSVSSILWQDGYPALPFVFLELVEQLIFLLFLVFQRAIEPSPLSISICKNILTDKTSEPLKKNLKLLSHILSLVIYIVELPLHIFLAFSVFLFSNIIYLIIFITILPGSLITFFNVSRKKDNIGSGYSDRYYRAMYLTGRSATIFAISSLFILFINYQIFKRLAIMQ